MAEHLCYVVHPVETDFATWQWVFDELIAPVAREKHYTCELGKKMGQRGVHIDAILERLIHAELAVVDVTEVHDTRLFYLLGIRHTSTPRTILIADNRAQIPHEFGPYVIPYSDKTPEMRQFRTRFAEELDRIEAHPDNPDNPVQAYLQRDGRTANFQQQMASLQNEVEELRRHLRGNAPPATGSSRISFKRIP